MAIKVADLYGSLAIRPDRRSFSSADRLLGIVKKAVVGIAGLAAVRWAKGIVDQTRQTADEFNKMSQRIGVSTLALQKLDFAAQLGGADINVIRTALQRFARTADDAANRGSKMAVEALERLGVEAQNADGTLKGVDEMLLTVSDTFAAMPDGTEKTALAMQAFGRSGAEMIPMLNGGSEALRGMFKEAEDLGFLIDRKTGKKFEELNDDVLRASKAIEGFKNRVVIALIPHIGTVAQKIQNWMKANKDLIQVKIEEWMDRVIATGVFIRDVFSAIADAVRSVTSVVGGTVNALKILIGAFVSLKALKLLAYLGALAARLGAVGAAAGAAGAAATVGAGAGAAAGAPWQIIGAMAARQHASQMSVWRRMGGTLTKILGVAGKILIPLAGIALLVKGVQAITGALSEEEGEDGKGTDKIKPQEAIDAFTVALKEHKEATQAFNSLSGDIRARLTDLGVVKETVISRRPSLPGSHGAARERQAIDQRTVNNTINAEIKVDGSRNPELTGKEVNKALESLAEEVEFSLPPRRTKK